MPESDMQPSPIADTAMPEEPSTRVGSFSTLLMFCHLTEFLTPLALVLSLRSRKISPTAAAANRGQRRVHVLDRPGRREAACRQRYLKRVRSALLRPLGERFVILRNTEHYRFV